MQVAQDNLRPEAQAFLQACSAVLTKGLRKITHCLEQLSDQEIWQRPQPEMNSIANLLLHVCGNLRQWIISGVGGEPDVRNRSAEFTDRSNRSKRELLDELESVIGRCQAVLAGTPASRLLETRRIQGFEVQLPAAILDPIAHFQGHVQEIVHMTRAIRGPQYRFYFVPKGKDQGGAE